MVDAARVSDPSRLHLKKELTQIRKASRVLRDPGTTSTWKSPLASSRSAAALTMAMAAAAAAQSQQVSTPSSTIKQNYSNALLDTQSNRYAKEKKVRLYNWKSNSEKSSARNRDCGDDFETSSCDMSVDDSLSDARNTGGGGDAKSDTYSMIFRCRDTNQVSSSVKLGGKKKGRKSNAHVHVGGLSKYKHRDMNIGKKLIDAKSFLEDNSLSGLGLSKDEQSYETDDYSNSEDIRRGSAASPLLLKLNRKNWSRSQSKFLRNSRRADSSCTQSTPALSTSSYNRYVNRNPSTVESWDATTASCNDGDDEIDDPLDLPGRQGCGIPCYWTKRTPKHRGGCRSCYSPSLSDTIRKNMFCGGSQTKYQRRRRSSSIASKRKSDRSDRGVLPLLTNYGRGGSSIATGQSDDELSTNFGELELEALSRLDGRRWSASCRSEEGLEIVPVNGEMDEEGTSESIRSLSQKYRPLFFDEIIGQNIVVQSLMNAIARGRIAPVYLFQGPRGTGKTSTAWIFAAALNCLATETVKPCGYCRECSEFASGKSRNLWEIDSTNKKGIDRARHLFKNMSVLPSSKGYMVFVIDECQLLPAKTWLAFLKFLEEPPHRVVFIFITTDLDNVPRSIQSRCQKYIFNKIEDIDIVARLKKIALDENLEVELDALDLIANSADGSLRDAETMLDQLSLLGKKITMSLVNELVGVVSDEKLLELLELAMNSNTAETVKIARELMDTGVCPTVLMSQLASLIVDIIAGTYNTSDSKDSTLLLDGRGLTEAELERLKHALKLLSKAEKQLRLSSERSTWFTATLLQLGSVSSPDRSHSGSRRQSFKTNDEDPSSSSRHAASHKQKSGVLAPKSTSGSLHKAINGNSSHHERSLSQITGYIFNSNDSHSGYKDAGASASSREDDMVGNMILTYRNLEKLDDIWAMCIEKCHSKTLRQLLHAHGKLLSISEFEGVLVAYVAFEDGNIKSRAERFLSSITNAIEIVLKQNVEVRIIHLPDAISMNPTFANELISLNQMETTGENDGERPVFSDLGLHVDRSKILNKLKEPENYSNCSPVLGTARSADLHSENLTEPNGPNKMKHQIPVQRIESIIRDQRLETAWLQALEKGGTPGSVDHLKPEKNQVLPQERAYHHSQEESTNSAHWEDELNHELKVLKINDTKTIQKDQIGRRGDLTPSLLHDRSSHHAKDKLGYESSSTTAGCSGLFCWKNNEPRKREKTKGTVSSSSKTGPFSLFSECAKPKKSGRKVRR
ncbi:hypothetical protein ACFE04_024224 [Oxalis oulophora]